MALVLEWTRLVKRSPKIRLFVDAGLGEGQAVPLSQPQAHYLFSVMRRKAGEDVLVFNGRDGEWRAEIVELGKRKGVLACQVQTRQQTGIADIWLMFAPVKKTRTDFIVEKATELGVTRIMPVLTEYTNSERVRPDRLRAIAIEAAEQSRGLCVPEIAEPAKLGDVLDVWDATRRLLFCNERRAGEAAPKLRLPAAVLIGPEGGFSPSEAERLAGVKSAISVSLGPRILRADTAAVAALTLVHSRIGDWT